MKTLPWWTTNPVTVYLIAVGIWYTFMSVLVFNGWFQEITGHHRTGHTHSRMHHLVWQFHTGLNLHPQRSFGDEKRLKRTASSSTRATPEGDVVYFARRSRKARAGIRNGSLLAVIAFIESWFISAAVTAQAITVTAILLCALFVVLFVRRLRANRTSQPAKPVKTKPFAKQAQVVTRALKQEVEGAEKGYITAGGEVVEEKPQLDAAVPVPVMAQLLAGEIAVSPAEAAKRLTIEANKGTLELPDHFPALAKQRATIEEIIQAQTSVTVGFHWATSAVPRQVSWIPRVSSLPRLVTFREHLAELEKLPRGVFGIGYTMERTLYAASHNGDTPWHLRSAGSGTGKSTGFQVKLAQICHQDPMAEVYCIDTKQVSFAAMHGIPGVHIYDDPADHMRDIWQVFYVIQDLMRDRYTALREGRSRIEDFNNVWVLVDEGNDLAGQLKNHYTRYVKQTGDPAQPKIWTDAIVPLINLGRQVGIRGEWMFQNMTDRVLGGVSLRDSFNPVGMAGYKPNQWSRIIGTTPVPKCLQGPGRICMVTGPSETWVQGFYDSEEFLRDYAIENRKLRKAS